MFLETFFFYSILEMGMLVNACNPDIWVIEAGGSRV